MHYSGIKFFIRHGIRPINTHTVHRFKQFPWLAKFIKYNTETDFGSRGLFDEIFKKMIKK